MKQIKLTKGLYALVDNEDYDLLVQYSWSANYDNRANYWTAKAYVDKKVITMHRLVLNLKEFSIKVLHKNGNRLDNRKENLYIVTQQESCVTTKVFKKSKTGFKGVTKKGSKFKATLVVSGEEKHLGLFDTPEKAAKAYNIAAKKYFGELAYQN